MRIVLVDDSVLLREGLARLLQEFDGLDVVAQLGDASNIIEVVRASSAELVILDIRMPPTHTTEGVDAAALLNREVPEVAVVVMSQYLEPDAAAELVASAQGGFGYLLKDRIAHVEDFVRSVRDVAGGGTVIDPELVRRLVGRDRINNPIERLTGRERDVFAAMAEGRSNSRIATDLFLNHKTVESHVRNIFTKLDLPPETEDHRRVRAVITWLEYGSDS